MRRRCRVASRTDSGSADAAKNSTSNRALDAPRFSSLPTRYWLLSIFMNPGSTGTCKNQASIGSNLILIVVLSLPTAVTVAVPAVIWVSAVEYVVKPDVLSDDTTRFIFLLSERNFVLL
jgi:hypothetical protein